MTGCAFMDAQYTRTLVETGISGLAALLWLVWSALWGGVTSFRVLRDPEERGLAIGFVAGLVGFLVHPIGANILIIIRVMAPFWFFAVVVVALPVLVAQETAVAPKAPAGRFRRAE